MSAAVPPRDAAIGDPGTRSVYDFWLGLLPAFFSQLGAAAAPADGGAPGPAVALPFPADEVARAATITRDALQALAQVYAPMLQAAGVAGLLGQWAAAMQSPPTPWPWLAAGAPWSGAALTQGARSAAQTFDRTYGALGDALGFGPMRKLQVAGRDAFEAGIAQNEARARYAMLVQQAFASGFDALLQRLADMGARGERVDSVLALLRLWAVCTEAGVHAVLQSPQGLEATVALARAGLAWRRRLRHVASVVAEGLDMATRQDLEDAYREIQELKRELRARRPPVVVGTPPRPAPARGARKRAR